jgi:AcrR family transcriptional regulator
MTAPALYRYFPSHEALLAALVGDLYGELADEVEAAAAPDQGTMSDRIAGASRAFRRWSVSHPQEFTLLFGSPIPGVELVEEGPEHEQARRFGQAFGRLFAEMWATDPFPVPENLDPVMVEQLVQYADHVGVVLPPEALAVFLSCWLLLYGAVTMEVFGHFSFALEDAGPLFEIELASLRQLLGLADRDA